MKKTIIACVVLLSIALIAGGAVLRGKYVYINKKFFEKDVEDLIIYHPNTFSINELNRCTDLDRLEIKDIDDSTLEKMGVLDHLAELDIFDSEINGSGIEKINMFPNLKDMIIVRSEFDLSNFGNNSLETIWILFCGVTESDLKGIANCPSLKKLILTQVPIGNCCTVTDIENDSWKKFTLTDSSCLSVLDNIEQLTIGDTFIEDISGIEDMDSLDTLRVTRGYISEDHIKALEDKGINVIYIPE